MTEGQHDIIALAEALRLPLLQLCVNSQGVQDPYQIQTISTAALRDIDAFITTFTEVSQTKLQLEPLYMGAILVDVAETLKPYANVHNANFVIDDHSKHQPIMGDSRILRSAYELIAKTLCDFGGSKQNPEVFLRADTRHGYPRLGVYRSDIALDAHDVQLAQKLLGGAVINSGAFHQLGALRIEIARKLLGFIGVRLRSARSAGREGIAMQLSPSVQGQLFSL